MDSNENKPICENKPIYISVLVAFVLVAVMLVSYALLVKKEYRPLYSEYDTVLNIEMAKNDTLITEHSMTLAEYTQRVDSLMNKIAEIQGCYQHDIDLMIYKTNQWLTFWLAAIGIVVGFLSVLNIYSKFRFTDEFNVLKTDNKSQFANMRERIKEYKVLVKEEVVSSVNEKIEKKIADLDKSINTSTTKFNAKILEQEKHISDNYIKQSDNINIIKNETKRTHRENTILTLMTCISTFPDPQMFQSSSDKKYYIAYFMKELNQQVELYLKEVETDIKEQNYELNTLILILANIKTAVCRCHPVYSLYHQNVVFSNFKQTIENLTNDLIRGKITHHNLMDRLEPLVTDLNELTNNIA